ncbi:Sensor protein of zinc sigma-54-dependent two-component system [Olavius algarvensis Delta 1 endosymbiont]|nr:Sensor protein of zinc sigma-54-dependent two-component system [Olavius algarvensis Delta 1 endosymbiont]
MIKKLKNTRFWTGVPLWALIGAAVILLPLFAFMTMTSINRQQEKSTQLLLEKGAALIRSFEAGTRTGMMGMRRGGFQLQQLLTETAQQPDIVHLLVADVAGEIIAHNNLKLVGVSYGYNVDLENVFRTKTLQWRILDYPDGTRVFEVYRRFTPSERPRRWMHDNPAMHRRMQQFSDNKRRFNRPVADPPKIIFVGLDMSAIDEAHRADIRHAVIMGVILLLVGIAGFTLLFLFQSYRTTRASLSRIKAFSDNVVENMPIGLIALDDRQRIAAFNHTADSLMQLSFQKVLGKTADQILPPELCKAINFSEIENSVIEKEIDCTVGNGFSVPLEIGASRLANDSGTHLGYVILFKDLTEVRALHQEVERSRRLASVGRLAAGVAHEIRNPLSSIKGFATYFKQRYQDVPLDQQTADIMIQEVDRLNRVVSQLLEFARPVSISAQPTSVKDLVDDSLELIRQQARDRQITIDSRNTAKLDEIKLDPDRLNQVLLNLNLNALEAMEPGGKLQIDVFDSDGTRELAIRISDTGQGIAEADLPKIFDPYFTTKSSGTGLGLAIAHNIVEAMGGTIEVKSEVGKGTVFTLRLPLGG